MRSVSPKFAVGFLAGSFLLASNVARAGTIPIYGTAGGSSAVDYYFSIRGPSLTLYSGTIDAPNIVIYCAGGVPCSLSFFIPAFDAVDIPGYSEGSLDGVTANILGGGLMFIAAPINLPTGSAVDPYYVNNVAVAFSGQVTGYHTTCPDTPCGLGPALFSLNIHGTGTVDAGGLLESDGTFLAKAFEYTFTGTATPTPEPTSVLLLASALALISAKLWESKSSEER